MLQATQLAALVDLADPALPADLALPALPELPALPATLAIPSSFGRQLSDHLLTADYPT